MDEAVRQQQAREELMDPRTQFLGAPEEVEFEADAQEAVDFTPGTEENLAESAAQVAKAQTEVWDPAVHSPVSAPAQASLAPTANEVLKTNLDSAGIQEQVFGNGRGLEGESAEALLEDKKVKNIFKKLFGRKEK